MSYFFLNTHMDIIVVPLWGRERERQFMCIKILILCSYLRDFIRPQWDCVNNASLICLPVLLFVTWLRHSDRMPYITQKYAVYVWYRSKPVQLGGELRGKLRPDEYFSGNESHATRAKRNGEPSYTRQTSQSPSLFLSFHDFLVIITHHLWLTLLWNRICPHHLFLLIFFCLAKLQFPVSTSDRPSPLYAIDSPPCTFSCGPGLSFAEDKVASVTCSFLALLVFNTMCLMSVGNKHPELTF